MITNENMEIPNSNEIIFNSLMALKKIGGQLTSPIAIIQNHCFPKTDYSSTPKSITKELQMFPYNIK